MQQQEGLGKYKFTLLACTMSVWVFGTAINLVPILFVPLMNRYDLPFSYLGLLIGISFVAQMIVMLLFSKLPDKIGLRPVLLVTSLLIAVGFLLLFLAPIIFPPAYILVGLILAVVVYGTAGGFMGSMINPLVNALPLRNKPRFMSLFHCVYAAFMIVAISFTSLFVYLLPDASWNFVPLIWVFVPLLCFVFWIRAPIIKPAAAVKDSEGKTVLGKKKKTLILFLAAMTVAMASEAIIAKGASSYIELGLDVPKLIGDLLGPAMFALALGVGRLLYWFLGKKVNIKHFMIWGSVACFILYLVAALTPYAAVGVVAIVLIGFATSLLIPGMMAATGEKFAGAGVFIFVLLSMAGKIGAAGAPSLFSLLGGVFDAGWIASFADSVGMTTQQVGLRLALLICAVIPLICIILQVILARRSKKDIEKLTTDN